MSAIPLPVMTRLLSVVSFTYGMKSSDKLWSTEKMLIKKLGVGERSDLFETTVWEQTRMKHNLSIRESLIW